MKTIAVLQTVHNRKDQTLSCLQRLFTQSDIRSVALSLFMTDDGCTDGTAEAVISQYPEVKVIKGDGSLFWNRGMYASWSAAIQENKTFDYFLWLNDDVQLNEDGLSHLLECSRRQGDNALIAGTLLEQEGSDKISFGGRVRGGKLEADHEMKKVRIMNGNVVLIPRRVYQQVGMNDPYYQHAFGDYDYALMAGKLGISVFTTAQPVGYCHADKQLQTCFDASYPLSARWKYLYSPLSYYNPREAFYFDRKHNSLFIAIVRYILIHLQTIFPYFSKRD